MMPNPESHRRQFVHFAFYKVVPEWRRLPLDEREEHRREFAETIRKWDVPDSIKVLSYSLIGLRAEADMMLWRICYSISCLQEMSADLLRTRLGGYLQTPYSYLGMTRRSEYLISGHDHHSLRGVMRPGGAQYLFVYPMVRTRAWYQLPFGERQRMVHELVHINEEFPRTHLNVIYSFGLDDQDFVVAVETDYPDEFVERMMRVRESESSPYIQRDSPCFSCVQTTVTDMLERIG
jgi:chlorite dismutase